MEPYVITIARQFGSLGRPIAKKMSELLNIEYYDREIVDLTAKRNNLDISTISNVEEKSEGRWGFMKFPLGKSTAQIQNQIFESQKQIILDLTEQKSCIVVGRCGDSILCNAKNHMSIFIYAPWEKRYENCINELRMTPKEAEKMIKEVDTAREAYYLKYAKYRQSDVAHKDILINSAFLGVDGTAALLADIVARKYGRVNHETNT